MHTQLDHPFNFDPLGNTATTTWPDHVRDMLMQFLFTEPRERVNRPDFGAGLRRLCLDVNSLELSALGVSIIRSGVERWLGDVVEDVDVAGTQEDAKLGLALMYRLANELDKQTLPLPPGERR